MATPVAVLERGIKPVIVTISLDQDGRFTCSPDPFPVSKGRDENVCVIWVCNTHKEFSVDFGSKENSPFYEWHFTERDPCSGLVRREILPDKEKIYKYTVRVGGKQFDPGGRVDP